MEVARESKWEGTTYTLKCRDRLKEGEVGGVEDKAQGALGAGMGAEGLQYPEG